MVNFSGSQRPKTDLPVLPKDSKPEIGRLNKLRDQASSIGSKTSREVAGKFKDGRQLLMDRALPQAKSLISNLHKLQTRYFPIFLVVLKSRSDAVRARLQKVARRLMASGLSDWARKGTNGEVGKKERAGNLAVLTVEEFLADWEAEVREAKVRVLGQSMNFEPYRSGEIVTRIFNEATPKGVRKELLLDWNARVEDDETSTVLAWLNPWIKERIQWSSKRKQEMWRQMRAAGTEIRFTNPPKNILEKAWPVTGRNHLKAAAVDERAFYIGGFNFGNLERDLADFMVKFTDPKVVSDMTKQWERINGRIVGEDEVVEVNEELTLLIDGGKAGRSVILDRVASEVGAAKAFVL